MNARPCLCSVKVCVLLALALFIFSSVQPARAQSGYPGSGPSPGWSAVDRNGNTGAAGLADDSTFYNFDWTRLYLARNCVYNGISDPDYSGPYLAAKHGGQHRGRNALQLYAGHHQHLWHVNRQVEVDAA